MLRAAMSMPSSAMASTAAGLTWSAGCGPGGEDVDPVPGEVLEVAGGHLGAAGVVHAHEQHGRLGAAVRRGSVIEVGSSWSGAAE